MAGVEHGLLKGTEPAQGEPHHPSPLGLTVFPLHEALDSVRDKAAVGIPVAARGGPVRVGRWVGCVLRDAFGGVLDGDDQGLGSNAVLEPKLGSVATGLSAKMLEKVTRFRRAIDLYQARPDLSLAELAVVAGYYDQPHMNRDFRALAGVSPMTLLSAKPRET